MLEIKVSNRVSFPLGNIASTSKQRMSHGAELKTKSSIAHEPHSIDHLTKGILHFIKQDDLIR